MQLARRFEIGSLVEHVIELIGIFTCHVRKPCSRELPS
jgi:hypothetical protein